MAAEEREPIENDAGETGLEEEDKWNREEKENAIPLGVAGTAIGGGGGAARAGEATAEEAAAGIEEESTEVEEPL